MNKKSMHVSSETVAAVSRMAPDRYGQPNRFTSRSIVPRTFAGSVSNLAQPAAQGPAAASNSSGSVSYSDKYGNNR